MSTKSFDIEKVKKKISNLVQERNLLDYRLQTLIREHNPNLPSRNQIQIKEKIKNIQNRSKEIASEIHSNKLLLDLASQSERISMGPEPKKAKPDPKKDNMDEVPMGRSIPRTPPKAPPSRAEEAEDLITSDKNATNSGETATGTAKMSTPVQTEHKRNYNYKQENCLTTIQEITKYLWPVGKDKIPLGFKIPGMRICNIKTNRHKEQ